MHPYFLFVFMFVVVFGIVLVRYDLRQLHLKADENARKMNRILRTLEEKNSGSRTPDTTQEHHS